MVFSCENVARARGAPMDSAYKGIDLLVSVAESCTGVLSVTDAVRHLRLIMYATALRRCGGNVHAAARMLGVDRRAVYNAIDELGPEPFEQAAHGNGRCDPARRR